MFMAFSAASAGTVAGAAYQLSYQIWIIVIMITDGWKAAGQVLLAREQDPQTRGHVAKFLVSISAALGVVLSLIFLSILPFAQSVMSGSPEVARALAPLWPWAAAAVFCAAIALALDGLEFGRGHFAQNLWRTLIGTLFWILGAVVVFFTGAVELLWVGVATGFSVRIVINLITKLRGRGGT